MVATIHITKMRMLTSTHRGDLARTLPATLTRGICLRYLGRQAPILHGGENNPLSHQNFTAYSVSHFAVMEIRIFVGARVSQTGSQFNELLVYGKTTDAG
jgi:hypothetical protein